MGIQNGFSQTTSLSVDVVATARSTDTVNYITDLLTELQTIAAISGLTNMSSDINAVVSKYMTDAVKV